MAMDRKAWQNIMDQMARQSEEDCTRADALGQGQKYNITFYLSSD